MDPLTIAAIGGVAIAGVGAITSAFADQPNGQMRLELPPELEEKLLTESSNFVQESQRAVEREQSLIPYISERVSLLEKAAQAGQFDPSILSRMKDIDAEITARFGAEELADIKSGLISSRSKDQAMQLQQQVQQELEAQGKLVDAQGAQDIAQAVRNRLSQAGSDNQSIQEIQNALMSEIRTRGDVVERRDPTVEKQLADQEERLKEQLRQQFGAGFENTTAGRRALQDFRQNATETRFNISNALKTSAAARLSQLAPSVLQTIEAKDSAVQRLIQNAVGLQQYGTSRSQRIRDLASAVAAPSEASAAITAARSGQVQNVQQTIQNIRNANAGNIQLGAEGLKLLDLPSDIERRALTTRAGNIDLFSKLGQFGISDVSRRGLSTGGVQGITARTELYEPKNVDGTVSRTFDGGSANSISKLRSNPQDAYLTALNNLASGKGSREEINYAIPAWMQSRGLSEQQVIGYAKQLRSSKYGF